MKTEYIRILNCNYERLLLEQAVEERKYQYCILGRGGIKYLLPCSLRITDEQYYLYYDISSKQNISQIFEGKKITREWIKHFLCEVVAVKQELERYLLEDSCIVWNPLHIYQDMERDDFYFMYIPYSESNQEMDVLLDFILENIDYEDDGLVEFSYLAYDRLRTHGVEYIGQQMYQEFLKIVEREEKQKKEDVQRLTLKEDIPKEERVVSFPEKKRHFFFWEGRRKRRQEQEDFRQDVLRQIGGYAVCEDVNYGQNEKVQATCEEEEFGKTIYIEETPLGKEKGLYLENGELLIGLVKFPFVIGKKRDSVDLVLSDYSISRIHARIVEQGGEYYVEDLNSTNGTYKNGLRLQPYEKRKLEDGDELRFGKLEYVYR